MFANAFSLLAFYGLAPGYEAWPKTQQAARRALRLDPRLRDAYAALLTAAMCYDWDWDAAEEYFVRGCEVGVTPQLLTWRCVYLSLALGRNDESIAEARRAPALDPLSAAALTPLEFSLHHAGRFEESLDICRQALAIDPAFWLAHRFAGLSLHGLGRTDEAIHSLDLAVTNSLEIPMVQVELMNVLAETGQRERIPGILEGLIAREQAGYVQPTVMGAAFWLAGQPETAVAWLERGYREHDGPLPLWNYYRALGGARHHPRFRQLMIGLGLVPAPDLDAADA